MSAKEEIEPLLVRTPVAAKMIGFSKSKLFELIRDGEIPTIKIGRSTLIEVVEIKRWIERQKAA
ncbi:MAG TPA: helix-turn-helix domain-containing protein [Vulgatibacter sp.]